MKMELPMIRISRTTPTAMHHTSYTGMGMDPPPAFWVALET